MDAEHSTASRWLVGLLAASALARRCLMQMGTINIQQVTKSRGGSDAQKESAFIPVVSLCPAFFCPRKSNTILHNGIMSQSASFFHPFIFSPSCSADLLESENIHRVHEKMAAIVNSDD